MYDTRDGVRLSVTGGPAAKLRESAGEWELLVPVDLSNGAAKIVVKYDW
jgi:hypothetical protein